MRWSSIVPAGFLLALAWTSSCEPCAVTVTSASFGSYDVLAASPLDTAADLGVTCDPDVPYRVSLDAGLHSGGDFHSRQMLSATGNSALAYNLYRDPARTEVLGDGNGNTFTLPGMGSGEPGIHRIYGRMPERQNAGVGHYSDSITVILEW